MKKLCLLLFLFFLAAKTQAQNSRFSLEADFFHGNILPHNNTIKHLITHHSQGILISFNQKTFGEKEWQSTYNFPDYGGSFHYQNTNNSTLGNLFGVYGHYNFYFFNRNLTFRVAQGISYNTNPFHKTENFRNLAYGSKLMPSTYFMLNYKKENIFQNIGVQAGISFFHHSNANFRSPNTSTNTLAANVGLNYSFDKNIENQRTKKFSDTANYRQQPIKFSIALRSGFNESDIINSGQFPFLVVSTQAEKRLSRVSGLQFGADFFFMQYLKEYIKFKSVAYPNENISPESDYKRVGIFVGHELYINQFSLEGQFGYYLYSPFKYLGPFYQRLGLKYYITPEIFAATSLKTHGAKAEALEFSVGIKF
ncbi:acyloxyacyl hydrolase [Flavobacterium sp. NST-5]|uniref:Acyloxyacyl hydrolase n=1 Tax=Flavobacterium ichthyis TaxID=2698827 RepID=A0ABW9Z5J5_9FLAO|nr:acyloxyacyl hydrolase [Flavobacterium ichthyis]NBL63832.1 acyloxyacyl hydrolase [Flavobacterium ichthyis]